MDEENVYTALVAARDMLPIELGGLYSELVETGLSGSFYDITSKDDLERHVKDGRQIFMYEEGVGPTRLIYDGTTWLDGHEVKANAASVPAIASMDGLLSVAELMQSELEATAAAMASIAGYEAPAHIQTMAMRSGTAKSPKDALDALFGKLLLGRMALGGQNIYDVASASRAISDEAEADAPTIFYDEPGEVSDGGETDDTF